MGFVIQIVVGKAEEGRIAELCAPTTTQPTAIWARRPRSARLGDTPSPSPRRVPRPPARAGGWAGVAGVHTSWREPSAGSADVRRRRPRCPAGHPRHRHPRSARLISRRHPAERRAVRSRWPCRGRAAGTPYRTTTIRRPPDLPHHPPTSRLFDTIQTKSLGQQWTASECLPRVRDQRKSRDFVGMRTSRCCSLSARTLTTPWPWSACSTTPLISSAGLDRATRR